MSKCTFDPRCYEDAAIGMFHCPECGEMVLAGCPHPDYSLINEKEIKMSHWNHRVIKKLMPDGSDWFSIHEVFYNDDGSIYAYTSEPVEISGESIDGMREYCQWILNCLDKEILVEDEIVCVDKYKDEEEKE